MEPVPPSKDLLERQFSVSLHSSRMRNSLAKPSSFQTLVQEKGRRSGGCGAILTGVQVHRAGAFDRARQLFELGRERLKLRSEETALVFRNRVGRFQQCFKHHRNAREDGFLDPFERLFEVRLLFCRHHLADVDRQGLNLREGMGG